MQSLINSYGSPVVGGKHFNRTLEKRQLLERMSNGQHTNLAAARRTGKTSLMRETLNTLGAQGWATLEIDFSKCHTLDAFFNHFTLTLKTHLKSQQGVLDKTTSALSDKLEKFGNRSFKLNAGELGGIEIGEANQIVDVETSFSQTGQDLGNVLDSIAKHSAKNRLVIGIDELTVFFHHYLKNATAEQHQERLAQIELLLYMLRDLRQRPDTTCVWLHCSSIGLEGFVERHKISHALSALAPYHLEPFSETDTRAMLQALWLGKKQTGVFPEDTATRMIERLTWLMPFFTQLLFHVLFESWERHTSGVDNPAVPSPQDVDAAYNTLISEKQSVQFKHWQDRLDDLLRPSDAKIVRCLLNASCNKPNGISRNKLFDAVAAEHVNQHFDALETAVRDLLSTLVRDGYLQRLLKNGVESTDYVFRSPLLRDYWKNNCQPIKSRRSVGKSK
jgi:hypothetical protein